MKPIIGHEQKDFCRFEYLALSTAANTRRDKSGSISATHQRCIFPETTRPFKSQRHSMTSVTLPPGLTRLLWEYSAETAVNIPDEIIFAKVMERGSLEEGSWLVGAFSNEQLKAWFDRHAERHLSPRSLRLWACLLECSIPTNRQPQIPWIHS